MNFKIEKKLKNSLGRAGVLKTAHGEIHTPAFVPVGTKASVKALTPEQVSDSPPAEIVEEAYNVLRKNKKAHITEDGVKFQSIIDGSKHFLSPEKSIKIQNNLNICLALVNPKIYLGYRKWL